MEAEFEGQWKKCDKMAFFPYRLWEFEALPEKTRKNLIIQYYAQVQISKLIDLTCKTFLILEILKILQEHIL